MNSKIEELTKDLNAEERKALLAKLQQEEKSENQNRRKAYEELREDFVKEVKAKTLNIVEQVKFFRDWMDEQSDAFRQMMREYGELRKDGQMSFTVLVGDFKVEVRSNKVKAFDERADVAAERLMNYLEEYIQGKEKGTDDPMYQLTMSLLQRNRKGSLDFKSISKLYELESKFASEEYSSIMQLFKESNVVLDNAINYYFFQKDDKNVWQRIEPSFCRL